MAEFRIGPVGIGTVTVNGTVNVAGSGTDFTDYQAGDAIIVILAAGTHVERTIDTITDADTLTVTSTFSASESGRSFYILRKATDLFSAHVKSIPYAGQRRLTLAGTERVRGYARSTWLIDLLTVAEWTAARDFILGADTIAGSCYCETRDNDDNWYVYETILNWPSSQNLERRASGGNYLDVRLPLILVEEIA